MDQIPKDRLDQENSSVLRNKTSMGTLISWNISKAIEANPNIDLKSAIRATHQRLQNDGRDFNSLEGHSAEEQYLACALLAWQQLGHNEADSLHQFVEAKQAEFRDQDEIPCKENKTIQKRPALSPGSFISYEDSTLSRGVGSSNYDTYSLVGPVVKLPVDTKIVMRLDNTAIKRPAPKKPSPDKDLMNKIDAACCMESACMEKLSQLDKSTTEMRTRAERLARREAERVELLERAEAAWKDLELGYQRRLAMAEEKEEDMARHIKKLIEERNGYKNACTNLAQQLRERGEVAEKERAKLTEVEKEVCENACMRLRVSEEAARLDAALVDQQCKAAQLDRDLQFKEEQIRRKLQTMESELESTQCLSHEAERALHGELSALRQQVTKVSNELLGEDAANQQIKEELELLRGEKQELVDDLDGCKAMCDGRIQGKMDALKTKREQLKELQERVMECQCKLPVDASVEAKRTPSLAALCKCSPEDKYLDSCSCTSLRSSLLSNLLADLFGGLQSELGGCGSQMPCQLLKCLEDRHNWDKTSIVKTNLRNYFSQLLIGELDIAIATSIEKYHAKWVGASCADAARMIPDTGDETEGWQERALERRAQKLASKLAEQLFQERADQLTAKAREVIKQGPPPCECKPRPAAVYPVLVKQPTFGNQAPVANSNSQGTTYWKRTHHDVTQLKAQLEDLKKDSIKKQDLKLMEENIVKLVQRATVTDDTTVESVIIEDTKMYTSTHENGVNTCVNVGKGFKNNIGSKFSSIKKKQSDQSPKKANKSFILSLPVDKPVRSYKKVGRSYAVNMCLCGANKETKKILKAAKRELSNSHDNETKKSPKYALNIVPQMSSEKACKLTSCPKPVREIGSDKKSRPSRHLPCRSDVTCFHKAPSNTSIDKLLETLTKWQCDLSKLDDKCNNNSSNYDVKNISIASAYKESDKTTNKHIQSKVSKNLSALPYRSNVIVANVSKTIEVPCTMPMATESEYMGAVNLDYVGSVNHEQSIEDKCNILNCIDSTGCNLKKSFHKYQQDTLVNEQNVNNKNAILNDVPNKIDNKDNIERVIETPTNLPSDCQYCIKFLGVTLTNAKSNKNIPEKDKLPRNERSLSSTKKNKQANNHPEVWFNNINNLVLNKPRVPSCVCVNDKEKKTLGVAEKQHGDFNKNEDKSIDTQSIQNTREQEGCVCCNVALNETKDLEVNAFHLLEEHLREKLEEFKVSNCKSSCISPREEERLFSTILQRVKQLISDNTSEITCKCGPEELGEGSWHRAYMLLEEYLKTKIKRVQCLCLSAGNTNETVLPNVLQKVCTLIDNDFKRLKEVCKCNNEVHKNYGHRVKDIPEKDTSTFTNCKQAITDISNNVHETERVNKEISNNSIIVTQNTSSQISPYLGMNSRSCDIMSLNTRDDQTSRIIANQCSKVTETNYDSSFCTHSTKIAKSYQRLFGKNDMFINQCFKIKENDNGNVVSHNIEYDKQCDITEAADTIFEVPFNVLSDFGLDRNKPKEILVETNESINIDIRNKVPYIGYTVDCSCNGILDTCTCPKSLITRNDNINSIWNTLTSNKLRSNNISYIMDAVEHKHFENDKNIDKSSETNKTQFLQKTTCDSKTGVQYYDEIVLKDSNDNLNKHFMSTTTSGDDIICFNPDFNSEPIEWCECSSVMKQSKRKMNDPKEDNYCEGALYYPVRNLVNRGKSTGNVKSDPINLPKSFSSNCDCNMVPMCHVKMLVENIENKLIHSKCTCDSLSSKICPVHSKQR